MVKAYRNSRKSTRLNDSFKEQETVTWTLIKGRVLKLQAHALRDP